MKRKYFILVCLSLFIIVFILSIINSNDIENINANINQESNILQDNVNQKEGYEVYSYITDDMRQKAEDVIPAILCYGRAFTPDYLNELSDHIAIIRVISIDEMDMSYSLFGMTKGKLLVNNSLKGDFSEGQVINFGKLGGVVDAQTIANVRGNEYSFTDEELKNNVCFNFIREFDINIEEGKTYLVYLNYNENAGVYEILGLKYGLREINIPQEKNNITLIDLDFGNIGLKNNDTNEYENLQEYIDKYIN